MVSWGNGWITLNTRHGLHKRHAFELTCAEKRGDDNDNDNDNDDHNDHNDHNDDDDESLWPQIPVEVDPDAKVPRKRVQKVTEEVSDDDEDDKIRTRSRRRSERRRKRKEEKEKDKDKEKEKENSNSNSNSKEKKTGGRGGKKGAAKKNSKSPTNTAVIDVEAARKKTAENQREKAKLAQIQLQQAVLLEQKQQQSVVRQVPLLANITTVFPTPNR